uniref:RNA-directed RNA polymerase L n=2 Tax=Halophytophthora RNA virus 4 TaxID=2717546 RepID=A0A7D5JL93_9VIRU|nr:RNA-dependent RNA polymerase [Halophytophthora RNA virus 4]
MSFFPLNPYDSLVEECDITHLYNFVQSRFLIKKKGRSVTADDSRVYYKLRHNVFKTYISFVCSIPSGEELPFSHYGLVDSERTPDFISYDMDLRRVLLFEFSVSNTKRATIANKESYGKYDKECGEIRSRNIEVDDRYFCMSLDTDTMELTQNIISYLTLEGMDIPADLNGSLTQLRDEFLYLNWHLSELMPELLTNSEPFETIKLNNQGLNPKIPFNTSTKGVGLSRVRNTYLKRRLKLKSKELLRSFSRKSRTFRFKLNYNLKDDVMYTSLDEDGLSKDQIMSMLQLEDDELMDYVNVIGSYEKVDEPFIKYGETIIDESELDCRDKSNITIVEDDYSPQLYRRLSISGYQTLKDCTLDDAVLKVPTSYTESLSKKRGEDRKVIIQKKNPFIFIPTNNLTKMGKSVKFESKYPISNKIFAAKFSENPKETIARDVDYDKLVLIESESSRLWSKIRNITNIRILRKNPKEMGKLTLEQQKDVQDYNNIRSRFSDAVSEAKRTTYKNRVTIPMSVYNKDFNLEMEHFLRKSNQTFVHPEEDFDKVKSDFLSLLDMSFVMETEPATDKIYSETHPIGINLKKSCDQMMSLIQEAEDEYLHTSLAKSTLFFGNLCYSLMYYSNIKLNKNDFCVDRMGYKNAMLVVRGGKKILSTRRSRLFRLCLPISESVRKVIDSDSLEFMTKDNQLYCITPWRQFGQSILKKGLELHSSFGNYYLSGLLENGLEKSMWQKFCSLKVLNMYSQKRKMEVWFSSLRYVYFNSTGTHTDPLSLISSMVEFDYDPYFYLIQRCFTRGYPKLVEAVKSGKIYDLLYDITYDNFDLCYERFEETAFMAKAPVDPVNEHLGNIYNVLKIHDEFMTSVGTKDPYEILEKTKVDMSSETLCDDMSKNDFTFDPKLCYLVGRMTGEMISTTSSKSELEQKFSNIVSESITEIATSKGMRSSKGGFWGEKGFDVVFSKLNLSTEVKELVESFPFSRKTLDSKIRDANKTFKETIESIEDLNLEFDMKDKTQYKGAREIYVMSDNTKSVQQPLEKFFRFLCTMLPNEIMHKKSHVRPKLIHRKVFENREVSGETMYCTLDCTKWAPKSNLWKYVYFVLGMSDYLPRSFVDYFLKVWALMFKKRVRIQKRYYTMMETNQKYCELIKHLDKRSDGDYELVMPYSFMMGIYNYLSSLFHAATQLYFNKYVSSPKGVFFNLMAHSDDSGGSVVAKKYNDCVNMFGLYETFQKLCNHLMSRKKSSLSKSSFELISIMYNNSRLIPMTHKFITNISLNPTGEGWYSDICSVVGKVVDAFNNGASMLQCYMLMLAQCEMTRKSYHLPRSKKLSMVPLHFGGVFNMHPIHLVLIGSCAQEVMLDLIESPRMRNFRINTYNLMSGDYVVGRGAPLKFKAPYFVHHKETIVMAEESEEILKNLTLLTEKSTLTDAIRYYDSIKMTKFKYALLNVDTFKLLYSSLFYKMDVVVGTDKKVTLKELCLNYMGFTIMGLYERQNHHGYSNEINYLGAAETITMDFNKNTVLSNKSCKPMIYHTFMNLGLNLSHEDLSAIKLYNLGEDYSSLLKNKKKWEVMTDWVMQNLGDLTTKEKVNHLSVLERADVEKLRSCYMFIPSGVNIDTVERFWTYTLMYCSRRRFISSSKPQFYTMEKFELWKLPFENMKHFYLMVKMALIDDNLEENKDKYVKCIESCKTCSDTTYMKSTIEELLRVKKLGPYERFRTNLPFATYSRPQYRGQNVWYGSSDFTLTTKVGKVIHTVVDGVVKTEWLISQDSFLDQIWHLYKLFCESRAIDIPRLSYDNTGFQMRRIAFNTLNMPFIPSADDYQLILENSIVRYSDFTETELSTDWDSRPTLEGELVDFHIYHVYDINEGFYKDHNLTCVKDMILPKINQISDSVLMNNFLESKLYHILSLDSSHKSSMPLVEKYKNIEMLGSLGSLTRALCLADEMSLTKYRSSVSTTEPSRQILEMQTVRDVPVIDLYNSSSLSRVTFQESKSLLKIANSDELEERDFKVLTKLADKVGIVSAATNIVNFRVVVRNLEPAQFSKVSISMKLDCLCSLIKAIHNCMEIAPKRRLSYQWPDSRKNYWSLFKLNYEETLSSASKIITRKNAGKKVPPLKCSFLTTHICKGIFRSNSDNEMRFWNVRRENPLAAIMTFGYLNMQNIHFIMQVLIANVMIEAAEKFDTFLKGLKNYRMVKDDVEFVENEDEGFEDYEGDEMYTDVTDTDFPSLIVEDEDGIDDMSGRDIPEEYSVRNWEDGEEVDLFINNDSDLRKVGAYTASNRFSSLRIHCARDYPRFTWLGPSNDSMSKIDGVCYYTSSYPGKSMPMKTMRDEKLLLRKESKTYENIYKDFFEKKKRDKEAEDKRKELAEEFTPSLKDYILEAFEKENLVTTRYTRKWLDTDIGDLNSILTKVFDSGKDLKINTRSRQKSYLPGFSGIIQDERLTCELKSIFGDNYHFITSGQVKMNRKTHKMLFSSIRMLYFRVNKNHKAFLTFLMSVMREIILTDETSDAEIVDIMSGKISDIQDLYESEEEIRDTTAPDPLPMENLQDQYKESVGVDWESLVEIDEVEESKSEIHY